MKILKENELTNNIQYDFFEFNNVKYFFEKKEFRINDVFLGFKKPKMDDILTFLEKEYNTKFVLIEAQFENYIGLSTQIVGRNIRYTSLNLPNLDSNGIKCEFIKTDKYKIENGNNLINLISNFIEKNEKDLKLYKSDFLISFFKEKLNKLQKKELFIELKKRNIKFV